MLDQLTSRFGTLVALLVVLTGCPLSRDPSALRNIAGKTVTVSTLEGADIEARVELAGDRVVLRTADGSAIPPGSVHLVTDKNHTVGGIAGGAIGFGGGAVLAVVVSAPLVFTGLVGRDASALRPVLVGGVVGMVIGGLMGARRGQHNRYLYGPENRALLVDPTGVTWKF